ncbi:MAG: DUF3084 domain-containing protein [Fretibacterium sp.]|nr:DUF3084 domain-containing protein [Fretibacterium sp.]
MQEYFWSRTNWLLILSLILGSATLAFLGDILGFKYGKQRISLFGLRPKYTSRLITAITGGVISVILLAVLSVLSQDVRTALFSMNYIQQQLFDLRLQLNESQAVALQAQEELEAQNKTLHLTAASLDIARLDLETLRSDRFLLEQEKAELEASVRGMREESDQLKRALRTMKNEAIALSANTLLAQQAFEPGSTREEVLSGMEALKQAVRLSVLRSVSDQALSRLRNVPIEFDPEAESALVEAIVGAEGRRYVRALSRENVAFGEAIPIRLEVGTSILIYPDGDPVYRRMYNAQEPGFQPEEVLHVFLRELKMQAIRDGVLPDPATNNVGTLDGEAFFDAVEALQAIHAPVIINALASGDIYTEGPVVIRLAFEE